LPPLTSPGYSLVPERTIYRDLGALAELGVPIEGAPGLGFVLCPGFFLPPLALTQT
jgi:predicted DNA-binding transcriptional regulator YafY